MSEAFISVCKKSRIKNPQFYRQVLVIDTRFVGLTICVYKGNMTQTPIQTLSICRSYVGWLNGEWLFDLDQHCSFRISVPK